MENNASVVTGCGMLVSGSGVGLSKVWTSNATVTANDPCLICVE